MEKSQIDKNIVECIDLTDDVEIKVEIEDKCKNGAIDDTKVKAEQILSDDITNSIDEMDDEKSTSSSRSDSSYVPEESGTTDDDMEDKNSKERLADDDRLRIPNILDESTYVHVERLAELGLQDYLKTTAGGAKSDSETKISLGRVAKYLEWSLEVEYVNNKYKQRYEGMNAKQQLRFLMTKRPYSISRFSRYLEKNHQLKPATSRNYLDALKQASEWILFDSDGKYKDRLCRFEMLLSKLRKRYSKMNKLRQQDRGDVRVLTAKNRWPKGGLKEIQAVIEPFIQWAKELPSRLQAGERLTAANYNLFIRVVMVSLYAYSIQGRPGAFAYLTLEDGYELLKVKSVPSTHFKTRYTYVYQMVTAHEKALSLIAIYLNDIRPRIVDMRGDNGSSSQADKLRSKMLFLRYKGEERINTSHHIREFFLKHTNLRINTSTIRSVVETTFEGLHTSGEVDGEVRRAVQNLNGHDSAITRAVYVRTNRDREVELANKYFPVHFPETANDVYGSPEASDAEIIPQLVASNKVPSFEVSGDIYVTPNNTTPNIARASIVQQTPPPRQDRINTLSSPQGRDWGIDHPHKGENSQRVKWTTDELNYIKYWKTHNGRKRKVQDCLDDILARASVRRMFHPHHIESASRLSHGWKRVEEEATKGETMSSMAASEIDE